MEESGLDPLSFCVAGSRHCDDEGFLAVIGLPLKRPADESRLTNFIKY